MRLYAKQNIGRRLTAALLVLLTVLLSAVSIPAHAAESGSCGSGLQWTYSAGTLTVTGSGDMTDYTEAKMPPWQGFADEILRVSLPDGITSVGSLAFYGCKKLKTVVLPDTVRSIGSMAFAGCEGLEMISLGKRVQTIGSSAFYGCLSLDGIRLPDGLESIGSQAFYRCESLRIITVPQNLTQMDHSVFAYCKSLVRATINARLSALPEWTFYGCERLTSVVLSETVESVQNYAFKNCDFLITVYYSGGDEKSDRLKAEIVEDVPDFEFSGYVSGDIPSDVAYTSYSTDNGDKTSTQESVSIREKGGATVVSTVQITRPAENPDKGQYKSDITVTVENKDGWSDASQLLQSTLKEINNTYALNNTSDGTDVTVYVKDGEAADDEFLDGLAGKPATLNVVTPNGSSWKVDLSDMKQGELPEQSSFVYTLSEVSEKSQKTLKTDNCYQLNFAKSAELNAEVMVQLPEKESFSNAFLYQVEKNGDLTRLQAVAVDQDGVAHFYLASTDEKTDYVIGLNVPGEKTDDIIIPDSLMTHYGSAVDRLQKIEFVTTGANSSWGLSFGQVTWILVGVLAVCIIAVGVVMTVMNKRKMKKMKAERMQPKKKASA